MRRSSVDGDAEWNGDAPARAASLPRRDIVAAAVAVAAVAAVVTNAAFLQSGPHPAPLFAKSLPSGAPVPIPATPPVRVVGQELTGPPPVAAHSGRPATEPARVEPPQARSRSDIVADIQRELARRGFFDGAIDGVHGPRTDAAMRDFEQATGLKPGSEANEVFLRAIMRSPAKAPAAPAAAPQPQRPDPIGELIAPSSKRVLAVQRALAEYGYGQIRPNGVFGAETKSAIEQFEKARKMPVTGQITPRLLRELSALTGRPLE